MTANYVWPISALLLASAKLSRVITAYASSKQPFHEKERRQRLQGPHASRRLIDVLWNLLLE